MSERAVAAAGVFEPSVVAGLLAKCRRTGGENMSNTDNMRVLAVVSTQLTHESFIAEGGSGGAGMGPSRSLGRRRSRYPMTGVCHDDLDSPLRAREPADRRRTRDGEDHREPHRLPRALEAAGCRRRAVRGDRLKHSGGPLRGRPRQGAGLRAAHARAGVIARDHHAEPAAGRLAGHRLHARGHLADSGRRLGATSAATTRSARYARTTGRATSQRSCCRA